MKTRVGRKTEGFTLIELLVVVLIIGILASIAIPQYFKVVERARVGEAQSFISHIKQSQERSFARRGAYVTAMGGAAGIATLDLELRPPCAATGDACGMANFTTNIAVGGPCAGGYSIVLARCVTAPCPGVSTRYGNYSVSYNSCTSLITYPGCTANCLADFN